MATKIGFKAVYIPDNQPLLTEAFDAELLALVNKYRAQHPDFDLDSDYEWTERDEPETHDERVQREARELREPVIKPTMDAYEWRCLGWAACNVNGQFLVSADHAAATKKAMANLAELGLLSEQETDHGTLYTITLAGRDALKSKP